MPIVRAVGGLDDTVQNWDAVSQTGNGFKFGPFRADKLLEKIYEARFAYADKEAWLKIQQNGMAVAMMAIGPRRRDILLLFIAEGVVLGIVGTIIGVFVGSLLAMLISQIGIPMPPGPGMTWGYNAGILLTPGTVVSACLTAMATTAGQPLSGLEGLADGDRRVVAGLAMMGPGE